MGKHKYQIYEITSIKNDRVYIGKTRRSAYKRLEEHITGHCPDLKDDIKKYGIQNFKIQILRDCSGSDDAKIMERFHIENASRKGKNLYNIYCKVEAETIEKPKRKLFGFILQQLKRSSTSELCKNDFEQVTSKLKKNQEDYIAVELDNYDVILVRKAN